jgi:hypothetical protein
MSAGFPQDIEIRFITVFYIFIFCICAGTVGLARSEARAEGLRKAGIEPVIGELNQLDVLSASAASGA